LRRINNFDLIYQYDFLIFQYKQSFIFNMLFYFKSGTSLSGEIFVL